MKLLDNDWDRTVHLLHSLFSTPVRVYLTAQKLFAYLGNTPKDSPPPVVDILLEPFAVRRAVRTVPWDN